MSNEQRKLIDNKMISEYIRRLIVEIIARIIAQDPLKLFD